MDPLADEVRRQQRRFVPPPGMAELLERWTAAVGPEIGEHAWPARFARDGTLHVATADAVWAYELGQRASEVASALDVARVRFAPGPLPEATRNAPPPAAGPSPAEADTARSIAAAVGDGSLRETVQKAISLGLARARFDRSF